MSYILEALKRSQEERELGRVPTLDSLPPVAAGPARGRAGPWVLTALLLAALAMALALYGMLRQPPAADGIGAGADHQPERRPAGAHGNAQHSDQRSVPAATAASPPVAAGTPDPTPAAPDRSRGTGPVAAPRRAPVQSAATPAAEAAAATPSPPASVPQPPRQTAASTPQSPRRIIPPETAVAAPADLRQDVEAFRRRILQERGEPETTPVTPRPNALPPRPATRSAGAQTPTPPATLRGLRSLPSQVQVQIPPHRMSVHVYSADPARRFVIINGRRMREGEAIEAGLRLEAIQPDGVVLGYGEHRFFSGR